MTSEIAELTRAVEEKITIEIERVRIETERLTAETKRLERELSNARAIEENTRKTGEILKILSEDIIPSIGNQSSRIELIFEFVKSISGWLYHQGDREVERLNNFINDIGKSEGMKIEINADGDVNTGDIVDGINIKYNIDIEKIIKDVCQKLSDDNIPEVENILNSLPGDALDIVLAALQSKFSVAKVVIEKIAGKVRLKK